MPPSGAAVRITHPYENGVDRIVRMWSLYCQKIAVYQHDDDGANNLHCHIHLEGFTCGTKRLQQLAQQAGVPLQKQGVNGKRATSLMAFRQKDYDFHPAGYAYLTKGKYDPKYLQGFTKEEAKVWKETWKEPSEHVKETTWKKLFDKFLAYLHPDKPPVVEMSDDRMMEIWSGKAVHPQFLWILAHGRKFCRLETNGIRCPQYRSMLECVVISYCWKFNITTDKEWKRKEDM